MKRTKSYLWAIIGLLTVALTVTSCMKDEKDDYVYVPLTQAQKTMQINAMAGSFEGKMSLFSPNGTRFERIDSTDIKLTITNDSTLSITNFPLKLVAREVTEKKLKETLDTTVATFTAHISLWKPYKVERMYKNHSLLYFFGVWPYDTKPVQKWVAELPYTYESKPQTLKIEFDGNFAGGLNMGNYNLYNSSNKRLAVFLVPKEITLGDGKTTRATGLFVVSAGQK